MKEQTIDNRRNIYNLPYKTEEILKEFKPEERCSNLGLLLDKYMPKSVLEKEGKAHWLSDIFKSGDNNNSQNNHIDEIFAKNAYQRWKAMMKSLGVKPFDLTLDWRMVVGLGGETILETDITLHHLYGIPIIPGSALKGLTRAYVSEEYKKYYVPEDKPEEEREPSHTIEKDHSTIKRIFGTQTDAGTVCFFDAMPLQGQAKFVVDIMNPHYPKYYNSLQSNKIIPPTNDQQPNPVTFLTVMNTTFSFALIPRNPDNNQHKADVDSVKKWLQEALQKYGVGGKTSAGYGYFKVEQQFVRPDMPQFSKGEMIRGKVIDEKTDPIAARYIASGKASKCLQYQVFSSNQVLILIDPTHEEAKQWKVRNESICQFIEEQVEDNRTLLICAPRKKSK